MFVEPDDRIVPIIAVIVPGELWCEDQVARLHLTALALHGGVAAAAPQDEPERRESVAMGADVLVGLQMLEGGVDSMGGVLSVEAGIGE